MRRDRLYLVDMLAATEAITRFVAGISPDEFLADELRQSAVLQKLSVIGEAASSLSDDFRRQYPAVEWQKIRGLRNIIVHHYFSLDFDTIWVTAKRDVPALQQQIQQIVTDNFNG